MSSLGIPRTRSSVSTRSAVCDQIGSGTYRSSEPCQLRRSTEALAPSRCRSSSAARVLSISATISRGRSRLARGWVRSTSQARLRSTAMSSAICFSIPGRSTFTTTSRGGAPPSPASVAACTWAIDAEASGSTSKSTNASPMLRSSACSTSARAAWPSNGAT